MTEAHIRTRLPSKDAESEGTCLVLVDGQNLLWRAAFGFPTRVNRPDGEDVTAPFGFFALLRKGLQSLGMPSECVVVFDSEFGWSGRQRTYTEYKGNRADEDYSPIQWLDCIQKGLTRYRIQWQESGEWEADDVIASIISQGPLRDTFVMSTDRDFHQLLGPNVFQLNTARAADRRIISAKDVRSRYSVHPDQWCDYVALVGDRSDGIPGIQGIGPIRAAHLLRGGLHLEDLPVSGRLSTAFGRHLLRSIESALLWRDLVRLRSHLETHVKPTTAPTNELPLAATVLQRMGVW